MLSPRSAFLALLISTTAFVGGTFAQNKNGAGNSSATKVPGSQLSPDKQAALNRMPRMSGRYRAVVRRNLEMQQAREDVAKAAAEQKAEADRNEALRKAELRRSAADASRVLKEREQDRAERTRKQGDAPGTGAAKGKAAEGKATEKGK